ncbi:MULTISPECIES: GtrA family protein [Arthrobacter]|nr:MULTISPECIES: GtrA family protein [Arthrobacter]
MVQSRMHRVNSAVATFLRHRVVRFLIVGGLSFAIDLGLLMILHEAAGVALWIATPVAFITSLVFNFLMQRIYTFRATNKGHVSAAKYGTLVVFNILATDAIVLLFAQTEFTYAVGKVVSTALTMVWNFFIYKYWIFPAAKSDAAASAAVSTAPVEPDAHGPGVRNRLP